MRVARIAVTQSVYATLPLDRRGKPPYVAYVMPDGDYIAAATRQGTFWFDPTGELVGQVDFPRDVGHLRGARLSDGGRPFFVGSTDSVGKKLVLLPPDGTPARRLRLDGDSALFADVMGDPGYEIVVSNDAGFLVYDLEGRLLKRVPASDYVWDFLLLNTNDTPRHEIVAYLYQNRRDGTFLEVIDVEGERIRTWHEAKSNRYSVSSWSAPAASIVAVRDDVITERSGKGEILRQYVVPGLGSYRRATTGVLDGDLRAILVANGGCPSRLLVFDARGSLVYDEVFEKYATLHVPAHGGREFIVATGPTLYRYRLGGGTQVTGAGATRSAVESGTGPNPDGDRGVYP